ncbi:MAG: hypothetical protein ACK4VO_10395 [Pseudobdellovibrio sp.]
MNITLMNISNDTANSLKRLAFSVEIKKMYVKIPTNNISRKRINGRPTFIAGKLNKKVVLTTEIDKAKNK